MSYALRPQEAGGARSLAAAPPRRPPDAGAELARESRRIQELIEGIRGRTATVQKRAQLLSAAGRRAPGGGGAREAAREARAAGEEARRLLVGLEAAPGSSVGEQSAARLRHRKLSESLLAVLAELEAAWRAFTAAEAAGAAAEGVVAAEAPPAHGGPADLEAGHAPQRLRALEEEAVAEAELDTHAAIVEEYTEQIGVVTRHVMDMRQALLDLAQQTRSQGQAVESLEQGMAQAADATSDARQQITITSQNQQKSMKCLYWALLMVVLMAAAVAGILRLRQ